MTSFMLFYVAMGVVLLAFAILTHSIVTTRNRDKEGHQKNG